MISRIRKLKGRSFAELRLRGSQAIHAGIERIRIRMKLAPVDSRYQIATGESHSLLRALLGATAEDSDEVRRTAMAMAADDHAAIDDLKEAVSAARVGSISLMGFGHLYVGAPPNWHRDGRGGVIAPRKHWSRIPYLDQATVGDHKVVWEVNRHQYLLAPALLWNIEERPEDFALVQDHLVSWLDDNPVSVGVNWCSSLEVAYRAITWCWLLFLLPAKLWDQRARRRVVVALEYHGRHIERYLSYYFSPNTHLTGEALGLFYLGHVLPDSRFASRWRELGAQILESCLQRQVYDDGVYFEQSTQYQRYTAEIYLHYLRICQSTGREIPQRVHASLSRQFDVLRAIVDGSGKMPLLGDDDGGALFPIDRRSPDDLRGLLLAGATALRRPELVPLGPVPPSISYWLCGVTATQKLLTDCPVNPRGGSSYFAEGGVAVIRDGWQTTSALAVVDAGRHGRLNCGHSHADALSSTLTFGEHPLFVDRGTLTYVGAERNEYRSSASHNVFEFDGESSVEPLAPFQWGARPRRPTARVFVGGDVTIFRGTAWGHADTAQESVHSRVVVHPSASAWLFLDVGKRTEDSRMILRWQLAPGLTVNTSGDDSFDVRGRHGEPLARVALPAGRAIQMKARDVSPRYGESAPAYVLEALADEHFRAITLILPAASLQAPGLIRESEGFEGKLLQLLSWNDSFGEHRLALPKTPGAPFSAVGWDVNADLLWCVQRAPRTPDSAFLPDFVVAIGARRLVPPSGGADFGPDLAGRDLIAESRSGLWKILGMDEPQLGEERD